MSSVHFWPGLCIPAGQELVWHILAVNKILTLQTYNRWRSRKVSQILFLENLFHLGVEEHCVSTSIETLILQPVKCIAPELIIFGEYRYDRN
jgi:hypothetical protein